MLGFRKVKFFPPEIGLISPVVDRIMLTTSQFENISARWK
jgi:hypothetical protein